MRFVVMAFCVIEILLPVAKPGAYKVSNCYVFNVTGTSSITLYILVFIIIIDHYILYSIQIS